MAKTKTTFFCSNCGQQSSKWIGKCPTCDQWNTYHEELVLKEVRKSKKDLWKKEKKGQNRPILLEDIATDDQPRIVTEDKELNRTLGGGIIPGSLVLVAGNPGIGKSTLLLQVALSIGPRALYVSGEESEQQIKIRADRITKKKKDSYIFTEVNVQKILHQAAELNPSLLIIDSIQTLQSSHIDSPPGSITQIRECTSELLGFAKERNIAIFIIGHITKEGTIAGPKLLEHMVDTVIQFEGDRNHSYRILRTLKNRFGSTDEIGIYQMNSEGLSEVSNPSELLLSQSDENLSGSAVGATLEGRRPMLIETQALVTPAVYGTPQRSATGFDLRRMGMLLAVLEKRSGFYFAQQDVFLNMAGGIKLNDPALDLAVASALISSLEDLPITKKLCFAGEIGLTGEIRAVNKIEQRILEADRLGFEQMIISTYNSKSVDVSKYKIQVTTLSKINELYDLLN